MQNNRIGYDTVKCEMVQLGEALLRGRRRLFVDIAVVLVTMATLSPICAFSSVARKEVPVQSVFFNHGLLRQFDRSTSRRIEASESRRIAVKTHFADRSTAMNQLFASATVVSPNDNQNENEGSSSSSIVKNKRELLRKQIKKEGGVLSFQTKYGALNPFAIYWGLTSIALGLVWLVAIESCRFFYIITFNRLDKNRRLPVFVSHVWGTLLMRFSRSFPKIENRQYIRDMYRTHGGGAMFVANHSSWNDIPFLGATIGWRNYKFVAKKELLKVPILNEAMRVGDNVIIDRSNRRDQIKTLKAGISWLKKGVNLCTFPEGTRSKTGRILRLKNGAFKMAHKAGAPVVPLSIVHANQVMPPHWMFPNRPARGICKVVVHKPVESTGKSEDELAAEVRDAIISGLPDDQKPLDK